MADTGAQTTPPWHAAFPAPQSQCPQLEAEAVMSMLQKQAATPRQPRDFLLVDVRRTDWEGGTIATSINLPAHTMYQTRPIIHQLCKQAGIKQVITYCGMSEATPSPRGHSG